MIPLVHDLAGKKVVIFGGGDVGERKARFFEGEADVIVVSRGFDPGLKELDVELVEHDLEEGFEGFLDGAFLVVPATSDRDLNREIADRAAGEGALVNSVEGPSEVVVPSAVDFDEFMVAITTFGSSPATSKFIRQELEDFLDEGFGRMVELQNRARRYLKENVDDQARRKDILWQIMRDEDIWEALGEGGPGEAWDRCREVMDSAV